MANPANHQKTGLAAGAEGERALPQPIVARLPISPQYPVNVELTILGKAIRRVRGSRRMSQMAPVYAGSWPLQAAFEPLKASRIYL
jgi:hypothetical protein